MKRQLLQWLFGLAERASQWSPRTDLTDMRAHEVLVLTAYTGDIAKYAEISASNKAEYARRHGYGFRAVTSGFDPTRPPAWSKLLFVRDALRTHRVVFWSDADSLVMNPALRIESLLPPAVDIHLARALTPYPHINTGSMIFRSSPTAALFVRAAWQLKVFTHDPAWEQRAINYLLETFRFGRVLVSPNRLFNSYGHVPGDPAPYQPGDFLVHFPGLANKASLIEAYAAESPLAATARA